MNSPALSVHPFLPRQLSSVNPWEVISMMVTQQNQNFPQPFYWYLKGFHQEWIDNSLETPIPRNMIVMNALLWNGLPLLREFKFGTQTNTIIPLFCNAFEAKPGRKSKSNLKGAVNENTLGEQSSQSKSKDKPCTTMFVRLNSDVSHEDVTFFIDMHKGLFTWKQMSGSSLQPHKNGYKIIPTQSLSSGAELPLLRLRMMYGGQTYIIYYFGFANGGSGGRSMKYLEKTSLPLCTPVSLFTTVDDVFDHLLAGGSLIPQELEQPQQENNHLQVSETACQSDVMGVLVNESLDQKQEEGLVSNVAGIIQSMPHEPETSNVESLRDQNDQSAVSVESPFPDMLDDCSEYFNFSSDISLISNYGQNSFSSLDEIGEENEDEDSVEPASKRQKLDNHVFSSSNSTTSCLMNEIANNGNSPVAPNATHLIGHQSIHSNSTEVSSVELSMSDMIYQVIRQ